MVDAFLLLRGKRDVTARGLLISEGYMIRAPIVISELDLGVFVRLRTRSDLTHLMKEMVEVGVDIPEFYIEPGTGRYLEKSGYALLGRSIAMLSQVASRLDPLVQPLKVEGEEGLSEDQVKTIAGNMQNLKFDRVLARLTGKRLRGAVFTSSNEQFVELVRWAETLFTSLSKAYRGPREVKTAFEELASKFHALGPTHGDSEYDAGATKAEFLGLVSELNGVARVRDTLYMDAELEGFEDLFEEGLRST